MTPMHARALLVQRPPRWTSFEGVASQVPPALRTWLTEPGLLTARIRDLCGEHMRFRMLGPLHGASLSAELAARLGGADSRGLLREIEFRCRDERVLYARTVLPDSTVRVHPWLAELGDSPIGESLRRAGGLLEREPIEYAALPPDHELALAAREVSTDPTNEPTWARRAVYRLDGRPILVQEVFLPALLRVQEAQTGHRPS